MYTWKELLEQINNEIRNMALDRKPEKLYAPIRYVLSLGGKRIRPVLMLLAYNLYKEDVSSIYAQALAIETYHNYTLLHDDLMDKADMRRGMPIPCWCWLISIWQKASLCGLRKSWTCLRKLLWK